MTKSSIQLEVDLAKQTLIVSCFPMTFIYSPLVHFSAGSLEHAPVWDGGYPDVVYRRDPVALETLPTLSWQQSSTLCCFHQTSWLTQIFFLLALGLEAHTARGPA